MMKVYKFISKIEKDGTIKIPDEMKNLIEHEVEITIIDRKDEDVIEKTKGTIKNLSVEIIKKIAESEDYCGY